MNEIEVFNNSHYKEEASDTLKDKEKTESLLQKVEALLSKTPLKKIYDYLTLAVSYVRDIINGNYKNYSAENLTIIVAGLAYLVHPLDLIADFIPFLGYSDDVAILTWLSKKLIDELDKYKTFRNSNSQPPTSK